MSIGILNFWDYDLPGLWTLCLGFRSSWKLDGCLKIGLKYKLSIIIKIFIEYIYSRNNTINYR